MVDSTGAGLVAYPTEVCENTAHSIEIFEIHFGASCDICFNTVGVAKPYIIQMSKALKLSICLIQLKAPSKNTISSLVMQSLLALYTQRLRRTDADRMRPVKL